MRVNDEGLAFMFYKESSTGLYKNLCMITQVIVKVEQPKIQLLLLQGTIDRDLKSIGLFYNPWERDPL